MGYIRHHAIVVTGWDEEKMARARAQAVGSAMAVSELVPSGRNGYVSFFVAPDGSKEGWTDSDLGDDKRRALIEYLNTLRYDDGSSSIDWAEVQYGDDNRESRVVQHSDDAENRKPPAR